MLIPRRAAVAATTTAVNDTAAYTLDQAPENRESEYAAQNDADDYWPFAVNARQLRRSRRETLVGAYQYVLDMQLSHEDSVPCMPPFDPLSDMFVLSFTA